MGRAGFKFLIFGAMLLFGGIYMLFSFAKTDAEWKELKENGEPAESVVVSIRKVQSSGRGGWHNEATVQYTYKDKTYTGTLNICPPELYEGQTVDIMIAPDNPRKFMTKPVNRTNAYATGGGFAAAGLFLLFLAYLNRYEIISYVRTMERQ